MGDYPESDPGDDKDTLGFLPWPQGGGGGGSSGSAAPERKERVSQVRPASPPLARPPLGARVPPRGR
jgi:hypothetical protein